MATLIYLRNPGNYSHARRLGGVSFVAFTPDQSGV